jgi:serine/threonine protein kinase
LVGRVLKHRYTVEEKIGDGNLFTVYRCEDKIDNRTVAAKVLLPQYASDRLFAERVLVEARAMIGVSHPGIVEVYDCGEQDGTYFVITEYVRGLDLRERIRRSTPLPLTTVVDIGIAICDVLDFAHKRGFVHGDLRPGNILVMPDGQIKLADFWVWSAVASSQLVRTAALMRSVHYMSPEVAEGEPATPASDIYSLGVILFELLTGKYPFDGDTPIAIALKHARDPIPSVRVENPGVPKDLELVVSKALQKAPQDRYRSAKAMLNDLKAVRDALNLTRPVTWSTPKEETVALQQVVTEDLPIGPPVVRALRKALLVLALVITAAIVGMLGFMLRKPAEVVVPHLIGKSIEQAEAEAKEKGLELVIRSEQFNEEYPEGSVYFMYPAPGRRVRKGTEVEVWVSKGSKFAIVPNVINLPKEEASRKIRAAGLNEGEVTQEYSDTIPAGNIVKQTPAPGTRVMRDQPVNLVFSLGPKPEPLPDVTYDGPPPQSSETRSFDVKLTVPDGPEDRNLQIVVEDDYGTNTAYSDVVHPGEQVRQTVQGVGDRITIRS